MMILNTIVFVSVLALMPPDVQPRNLANPNVATNSSPFVKIQYENTGSNALQRCNRFRKIDPRKALGECVIASKADPQNIKLLLLIASLHKKFRNYDSAELTYKSAISLGRKYSESSIVEKGIIGMASLNQSRGRYAAALQLYRQAKAMCETSNNQRCLAWALVGLGDIQLKRGYVDRARPLLNAALIIFKQKVNKKGLARTYYVLRGIAKSERNRSLWCNYSLKAKNLLQEIGRRDVASKMERSMTMAGCS